MHKVHIPQSVIDRVIARNGREHVHENLDPARTALIVVDMQNAFLDPAVAHSPCDHAQSIVPNINRMAQALREAGGTVVFLQTDATKTIRQDWSVFYGMVTPERGDKRDVALAAGSKGYALWADLDVQPDDLIVVKTRFSAFIQGSSDLEEKLRERGIDTLLIAGTLTNVCCESTGRDAMMLNFKVVMLSDANATITDEDHNASLIGFYLVFGDVMSTDFAIGCVQKDTKRLAAAE